MNISKQQLHTLVDLVENSDLDTLYNVMIHFIAEDGAQPDESAAIAAARSEYAKGEVFTDGDINWS
jgi:hypothetical protein